MDLPSSEVLRVRESHLYPALSYLHLHKRRPSGWQLAIPWLHGCSAYDWHIQRLAYAIRMANINGCLELNRKNAYTFWWKCELI